MRPPATELRSKTSAGFVGQEPYITTAQRVPKSDKRKSSSERSVPWNVNHKDDWQWQYVDDRLTHIKTQCNDESGWQRSAEVRVWQRGEKRRNYLQQALKGYYQPTYVHVQKLTCIHMDLVSTKWSQGYFSVVFSFSRTRTEKRKCRLLTGIKRTYSVYW